MKPDLEAAVGRLSECLREANDGGRYDHCHDDGAFADNVRTADLSLVLEGVSSLPASPSVPTVQADDQWAVLEGLAKAATPGPWKACGTIYEHMNCELRGGAKGEGQAIAQFWDGPNAFKDGQFSAAANPAAVLELIAAARAAPTASDGERAVMVCPQCDGEGEYADGLDEAACSTPCTRCGGNGWLADLKAIAAPSALEQVGMTGAARNEPNPQPTEVQALRSELEGARSTMCEQRRRLQRYGKSHSELDYAIAKIDAALSASEEGA